MSLCADLLLTVLHTEEPLWKRGETPSILKCVAVISATPYNFEIQHAARKATAATSEDMLLLHGPTSFAE